MSRMGKDTFVRIRTPGGAGGYIMAPVLTTTQRDALTAEEGMIIFNSTTDQLEEYDGATWEAVGQVALDTHAVLTTGVHGVGAGAIVGTTLTQTLTNKTLTSPAINGTVTTTGLTMPAFTGGGDISMGANALKTTNTRLVDSGDPYLSLLQDTGSSYAIFRCLYAHISGIEYELSSTGHFRAQNLNTAYVTFNARDTDNALVEVGRLAGAAEPWFGIGKDSDVVKATYDDKLGFYSTTPIAKQTGVAVDAAGIHAALVALGLIAA